MASYCTHCCASRLSSCLLGPDSDSPRGLFSKPRGQVTGAGDSQQPDHALPAGDGSNPPSEADFKAALADLSVAKKGEERLGAHLQSLYLTTCEKCGQEIQAESFLWRKGEDAPYARVYTCPHAMIRGNVSQPHRIWTEPGRSPRPIPCIVPRIRKSGCA